MKAFTLAIAATLALPTGALSQATYPDKPVRIDLRLCAGKRHRCFGATDG